MAKKHTESLGRQVERKVKELIASFPQEEGVYSVCVQVRAAPVGGRGRTVTV